MWASQKKLQILYRASISGAGGLGGDGGDSPPPLNPFGLPVDYDSDDDVVDSDDDDDSSIRQKKGREGFRRGQISKKKVKNPRKKPRQNSGRPTGILLLEPASANVANAPMNAPNAAPMNAPNAAPMNAPNSPMNASAPMNAANWSVPETPPPLPHPPSDQPSEHFGTPHSSDPPDVVQETPDH